MFDLPELEAGLRQRIETLDVTGLDGPQAVELVDAFDRLARLAEAGKSLAATQVEATGAWRRSGQRDAVGFVAMRGGVTRRGVRDAMWVSSHLGSLPQLSKAVRAGTVSMHQAADIAAAALEHPEVEAELVEFAQTHTLRELRDRCLAITNQGDGAEKQHRRAKAERSCSSQVGRDSAWRLSASMPVADGAIVDKVLDYFQTQVFDEARERGEREPYTAYRADALVRMAQAAVGAGCAGGCESAPGDTPSTRRRRGTPRRRSSALRHAIVVTVPHTTFLGDGKPDAEPCQVPGVGPVPASVVHRLMETDPIIKAVVTRGRDITATATLTRSIKEDLRLAVLLANDSECAVPFCGNDRFLELDHEQEYHKGGPTAYENLRPLCCFHHDQRTREGYDLRGSPGSYEWVDPDGVVLAAERSAVPV